MPKYEVELGSFVTKLMKRKFVVGAPDETTAIQRAEDRFRKACERNAIWTDCGDTIFVDNIKEV